MSTISFDFASTSAKRPDYLPPPPRPAALNQRGRLTRGGFLAALMLIPNFLLWVGYERGEDLRTLATQGQAATGHIALRG